MVANNSNTSFIFSKVSLFFNDPVVLIVRPIATIEFEVVGEETVDESIVLFCWTVVSFMVDARIRDCIRFRVLLGLFNRDDELLMIEKVTILSFAFGVGIDVSGRFITVKDGDGVVSGIALLDGITVVTADVLLSRLSKLFISAIR